MFMSLAYRRMGLLEQAAETMKGVVPHEKKWLAELADAGRRRDTEAYLRLERTFASGLPRPAYYFGLYDAALGNDAQALKWLATAYERRDECILYIKVDPEWDRLRADPRFKAIVEKVGLL